MSPTSEEYWQSEIRQIRGFSRNLWQWVNLFEPTFYNCSEDQWISNVMVTKEREVYEHRQNQA